MSDSITGDSITGDGVNPPITRPPLLLRPFRLSPKTRRGLVLPLAFFTLWQMASHMGWVDQRFLPPLENIAHLFWVELTQGDLLNHIRASLARDLTGFVIGTAAGIALGTLIGLSPVAERLINPTFNAVKQIAVLAWIPIISVWFGLAESAKIAFVTLAAFVPVVLNTIEGMQASPPQILEVGRALRFNRWQVLWRINLPAALPSILTGVHLALIYAWLATVGAEYFMSVGPGIGSLIIGGRENFEMDMVMLGVVLLGVIGYGMNLIAASIEKILLRWRDG